MTGDVAFVYGLIVLALVLFSIERIRIDLTAMLIMAVLMLSGIVAPGTALSGFSNVATVTVAAMFVLSAGLQRTGALETVGGVFGRIGRYDDRLAVSAMVLTVGVVSAFINNTAVVAIFIPIALGLAGDLGWSPSRLLMPLSFASMFGGVCTLIGTSTNLLVHAIAIDHGMAPFGMFEFAPLGVVIFVVGLAYLLLLAAVRLIPERRRSRDLAETYEMEGFVTDILIDEDAEVSGQPLTDNVLTRSYDVDIIDLYREGEARSGLQVQRRIRPGDVLRIRAGADVIAQLLRRSGLRTLTVPDLDEEDLETDQGMLLEAVVAADTPFVGDRIRDLDLAARFDTQVLAVRHGTELQHERFGDVRLSGGMSLLLRADRDVVDELQREAHFVVVSEPIVDTGRRARMPIAVATIIGVVLLAAFEVVPIVVSALTGCLVLVATGCLTAEEAYGAINWKIIFLLAGVLSLGFAMEETGAARLLADTAVDTFADHGPTALLGVFFGLSLALTAIISNNATAVLLAPIAIGTAEQLGVSARPFLVAVTFAASLSLVTPIGYQTNTLIYGPGQYRFTDFTKVGTPLNLAFWVIATLLIPRIWPF